MQLVTITPIRSHLNLRQGVNSRSPLYSDFLTQIEASLRNSLMSAPLIEQSRENQLTVQNKPQGKAYRDSGSDDGDTLCLFKHKKQYSKYLKLEAKVFSNTMSVVVINMDIGYVIDKLSEIALSLNATTDTNELKDAFSQINHLCERIIQRPKNEKAHILLADIYTLLGTKNSENELNLELFVQALSSHLITQYYKDELFPALKQLSKSISVNYLEPIDDFSGFKDMSNCDGSEVKQSWSSRFLRLNSEELSDNSDLISKWLANTPHPEHADEIIQGKREDSIFWLNYVVIDSCDKQTGQPDTDKTDSKIETMCLAQYYYAVQHACNTNLYAAISDTYLERNTHVAEDILAGVRATTRMHISDYHEHCQYLTRQKKELLDEILEGWDYADIVQNSERLLEICSSKIKDIHSARSEKSSFYTDLILVAIGFISLFDLAMAISEYSRAYTSSATLGYRDAHPSSFLSSVANIETDLLLSSSVITILLLFVVYYVAKRR